MINIIHKIPTFLMLIGIPGSGKTHWINVNIDHLNALDFHVVSPDNIRKELTGDISNLSQDKLVWNVAKIRLYNWLLEGKNVILDATNVNYFYRKTFLENIPRCTLKAKVFKIEPEVAKMRIINDLNNNKYRSNVPDEVIDRMHDQFIRYCDESTLRKEGFELVDKLQKSHNK